jgi:predicted Fe-S protein YdhL (DUF1289 family)
MKKRMNNSSIKKECKGICILKFYGEQLLCNGCGRTMQEIETAEGMKRSLPIVLSEDSPMKSH